MKNVLDQEQMKSLKVKTSGNIDRMLQFLYQVIGSPGEEKNVVTNEANDFFFTTKFYMK